MAEEEGRQKQGRKADRQGDRRHNAVAGPTVASIFFPLKRFSVQGRCRLMVVAYVMGLELS